MAHPFVHLPDLPGVEHRAVTVNGVRLHVAQAGDGAPLILLHGWPQHHWCWRHLIGPLAEHHRVIAPDLRGWGWSDAPPGDYAKPTFAADVVALMDAEGIGRAQVIGHDWGGYTAFLLGLEHPERIERIVALDIAPPWRGTPRPRHLALPLFAGYQALVAAPVVGPRTMTSRRGAVVRNLLRAGSGPAARWSDEELDVYANVLREPARAAASSACYRTFLTRELPAVAARRRRSGELEVPTLLIMGRESPLRRALDPRPSRNMRVEQIPGAGHFLPEEAPAEVLRLAGAHLTAAPRAQRR